MKVRGMLVLAGLAAAAVAVPALPAQAASVDSCPAGYVGVVVSGDNGPLYGVCVERGPVDTVTAEVKALLQDVKYYVAEWTDWVDAVRHMQCVMYDDGTIRCEMPSPPPLLPLG